jgi:hypothetical protein
MDPEGNGVAKGRGAEGGPSPPRGEQDKQLVYSSGGGESPMGKQGEQQDGSDATPRTHHAQSTYCNHCSVVYCNNKYVNVIRCLTLIVSFRRINHMVVKNYLHSFSDVHKSRVGHNYAFLIHVIYLYYLFNHFHTLS